MTSRRPRFKQSGLIRAAKVAVTTYLNWKKRSLDHFDNCSRAGLV